MAFSVHFCFTLEFLLPTKYPRESDTSLCSPHLPTWVGSTHGLWVCGFKKDTSNTFPSHIGLLNVCINAAITMIEIKSGTCGLRNIKDQRSVPGLAKLGGKQQPMDIIFPLFPIEFTVHIPL